MTDWFDSLLVRIGRPQRTAGVVITLIGLFVGFGALVVLAAAGSFWQLLVLAVPLALFLALFMVGMVMWIEKLRRPEGSEEPPFD